MARITIEDCLHSVENMYELVHLSAQRARQLYKGSDPLLQCKNKQIVTSLREIAHGTVVPQFKNEKKEDEVTAEELSALTN